MKTNGKILLLIVCAAIVIGFFSLLGLLPNMNDMYAKRFSDQLLQCSAPEGSLLLEHYKLIGKLNGNGNGMDFAAVILLQTNMETTKGDLI